MQDIMTGQVLHHHHHFISSEPDNTAYDSDANEQDQQGSTSTNSGP